ncbi:MAG: hypothetical protein AVO39_10250 [delta proteobacterium MLS_D]|nr:MAG: hypothetical protein AVO39_10250 [delta proteobacterium MLS_D]
MIIKYTGKDNKRIEGFGYMHTGEEKDFPEFVGKQLLKLPGFREVKRQTRRPAPTLGGDET